MKRVLLLSALAAAAAGCETYPQGDPYGAPYPPGDPYEAPYPPGDPYGAPYPPSEAPLPGGPLPPGVPVGQSPGSERECPIIQSRQWDAFVNAMPGPGARPTLVVTGDVVTARGLRPEFDPYLQTEPGQPGQLVARMRVVQSGPRTAGTTPHDVRWQWPLQHPIGSLKIMCGERTLAEIAPVPAAR